MDLYSNKPSLIQWPNVIVYIIKRNDCIYKSRSIVALKMNWMY